LVEVADAVDGLGVGVEVRGPRLPGGFQLRYLAGEPCLLARQLVGVGSDDLLPGGVGFSEGGGGALDGLAVSASGEDAVSGIVRSVELVVVGPPGHSERLVARTDRGVGPAAGAVLQVDQIALQVGLIRSEPVEAVGDVGGDGGEEAVTFVADGDDGLGGTGLVGDPFLTAFLSPVPSQPFDGFGEVAGGDVDVAGARARLMAT
jgi:hypothetical protein